MIFNSRILNNSLYLVSGEMISRVLRFFLVVYFARAVGVEDFGIYGFALSFAGIWMVLEDFGITPFVTREIARDRKATSLWFSRAFAAKLVTIAVFLSLILIIVLVMPKDRLTKWIVLLITLSVSVNVLSNTVRAVFHGHQQMQYDTLSTLFLNLSLTGFVLIAIWTRLDLFTFACAHLLASFLELGFILQLYKRYGTLSLSIPADQIRQVIKRAFPFGIQASFASAYCLLDSNMLAFMKGETAVGYYNAAYRFIFMSTAVAIAIAHAFFPAISDFARNNPERLVSIHYRGWRVVTWMGLTFAVCTHLWAGPVIVTIFGEAFRPSIIALQILGWVQIFLFINIYTGNVLRSIEKQNFTARVSGIAFFVNLFLNLIIIPRYGYSGAAATTLVTEMLVFLCYLPLLIRSIPFPGGAASAAFKATAACAAMAAVRILFPGLFWGLQVGIALLVNVAILYVLNYFRTDEYQYLFRKRV